ncbi:retrovirus-related pol polyprotein from transposon TNT 1-94 [Tanacetum coccineum]
MSWRASRHLELVYSDLCGLMDTDSLNGNRYFFLLIDAYSRMSWVHFLKCKSDAFETFKRFKALVEKQSECSIKVLHTDNRAEFCSKVFDDTFCEHQGIHRVLTSPYTPEQNGIAERKNRTVMEMARSMLKEKKLPDNLWAEAVATVVYLLNLSPTKAVLNRTPFEAWRGVKPSIRHLKVFDCVAYALIKTSHHKAGEQDARVQKIRDVTFNEAATSPWSINKDGKTILILCDDDTPTVNTEPISEPSSPAHSITHSLQNPTDYDEAAKNQVSLQEKLERAMNFSLATFVARERWLNNKNPSDVAPILIEFLVKVCGEFPERHVARDDLV